MTHTFVAYVDEAGDEGFELLPPPKRKSSEWFVISAAICRVEAHDRVDAAVGDYHTSSGKTRAFHFAPERHESRVGFIMSALNSGITFTAVIAHKPSLLKFAAIQKSHYLFYYCSKLLLERITWFSAYCCQPRSIEKVRIVFSDRGQLKREDLDAYLNRLRTATRNEQWFGIEVGNHDIKWDAIDDNKIEIHPHASLPGLQVADAVASGLRAAVEFTPHFATEHRYAKMLAPLVWRRYRRVHNYGLKFVPEPPNDPYRHTDRFHWLRHYSWPERRRPDPE